MNKEEFERLAKFERPVRPQTDSNSDTSPADWPYAHDGHRLSIPPEARVALGVCFAFLAGASLGMSHGGKAAGMRFRAENAHRLPKTQGGWYLYHKSKNYNAVVGGMKEGVKMGTKVGVWSGGFLGIEAYMDDRRGTKDFVSSAVAGLGVGAAFSLWNMLPLMTAIRTTKTGLYGGIAFGLVQDAVNLMRGRPLRYVDFVKKQIGSAQSYVNRRGLEN